MQGKQCHEGPGWKAGVCVCVFQNCVCSVVDLLIRFPPDSTERDDCPYVPLRESHWPHLHRSHGHQKDNKTNKKVIKSLFFIKTINAYRLRKMCTWKLYSLHVLGGYLNSVLFYVCFTIYVLDSWHCSKSLTHFCCLNFWWKCNQYLLMTPMNTTLFCN